MEGATTTVESLRFVDLLDLSHRLGRVSSFDWSRPFAGAGAILISGSVGAMISGKHLSNKWVLIGLFVGAVALVAAIAIRRAYSESVQAIKEDFDRMLALYQHDPHLAAMKVLYESVPSKRRRWRPRRRAAREDQAA